MVVFSFFNGITNSNGLATFSLTGLSSSATYTCSYSNVSDTCTVNVVTYYFIDDCSVDNTSNYTNQQLRNSSGTATLVYNSSERAYACNKTTSGYALLQFGDCTLHNNMKISADIKLGSSSWMKNGMLGFADATNPKTAYGFSGFAQGETYYRIMEWNGNSDVQTTSNSKWSSLSLTDYNHHELVYQDGVVTYTITNPSNVSKTLTLTLVGTNYIGGKVGLFVECNTSPNCYIKNIKAEAI